MSTAPLVGRETAYGVVAPAFTAVPCGFEARPAGPNRVLAEDRLGQDRSFAVLPGPRHTAFRFGPSPLHDDSAGLWLTAAFGSPTVSGGAAKTNAFALESDPPSLSLRWTQRGRAVAGYEALGAVVERLRFAWGAGGELICGGAGVAQAATAIAPPGGAFGGARALPGWAGLVTIGGAASAELVGGWIELVRRRQPFGTLDDEGGPTRMTNGARAVRFALLLDLHSTVEYDRWQAAGTAALEIVWTDAATDLGGGIHPSLTLNLGRTAAMVAVIEDGGPLPLLRLAGVALADPPAGPMSATLVSSIDYAA